MKTLLIAIGALASVACIEPPRAPVNANGASQLVVAGQSPPPSTADATMPASLPPPLAPQAAIQGNATYRAGNTFIILGGAAIAGGIAFTVLGVVLPCKLGDSGCTSQSDVASQKSFGDAFIGVGIGAIIVGVISLGVGIPVAIVGANQTKRDLGYALLVDRRGFGFRF